jgi:hypothetical protein
MWVSLELFAVCVIVPLIEYVAILLNAAADVKLSKFTVPLAATVKVLMLLIVDPDVIVNVKFAGIVNDDGPVNVPWTLNTAAADDEPKVLPLNVKVSEDGTTYVAPFEIVAFANA